MPQSITIAAFVFGAVLLLIALVGGGFKIFGAEVSGSAGKVARSVAGLGGLALLCVGLFGSFDKTASPANSSPSNVQPSTPQTSPAAANVQPDTATDSKSKQSDANPPINNVAASKDTGTQSTQAQQSPPVEPDVNIAGIWRDNFGSVFEVTQTGSAYVFRASGMNFVSAGRGTVRGHQLESVYETQYANGTRSSGSCTGTISNDLRQTRSKCFDNINGAWESIGTR